MTQFETDTPLRIIQVVNVRWFNATAWYGLFLSRLLQDAGHEVRVLGLKGTDSFSKAEELGLSIEDCSLNSANPALVASVFGSVRRMVDEFSPHIVNCHRGEGFVLWAAMRKIAGSRPFALIRTRGDQRMPRSGMVNRYLHTGAADAIIATSSSIAHSVRSILHVPSDRVHTIYGGVDTSVFYPDPEGRQHTRSLLGLEHKHLAVGLVGRFDAVKGQRELIEAFASLRQKMGERGKNLRLVLAGFATSSISEDRVKQWTEAAGIADAVVYPGRFADIRGLMNALDVGVVASLGSETIARVALEIMACGVPLVGTRVGVMPDLLSDEVLVSPRDPEEMAGRLAQFVSDGDFASRVRAIQAKRMSTLSEKDFYRQTLQVYQEALTALRK